MSGSETIFTNYPPLGIINYLRFFQVANSYQIIDSYQDNVLPANTLSISEFKTYISIVSQYDISQDIRITQILCWVLRYFENISPYSIFAKQWKAYFTLSRWSNFELNKQNIGNIVSIEYKDNNWNKTQTLQTLPATFTYDSTTLNTYVLSQNGNREPIIQCNNLYEYPQFYVEDNNIVITFNVSPMQLKGDLRMAMYQHAIALFNGSSCIPEIANNIYSQYCFTSGNSKAGGLFII